MTLKQILLDMALDEPPRNRQNRLCLQGRAREEVTAAGLQSAVACEHGPAGLPVVRLTGSGKAIERYLRTHYCPGDEPSVAFFMGRVRNHPNQ